MISKSLAAPASPTKPYLLKQRALTRIFALVAILIGFAGGVGIRKVLVQQSATLDVFALITEGNIFRVYYNDNWSEPVSTTIRPNLWTHYYFTVPARLNALRLDPSDAAQARAYIQDITLKGSGGGSPQRIDVAQLREWIGAHFQVDIQPDGIALVNVEAPGAYLMDAENIQVGSGIPVLQQLRLNAPTLLWSLVGVGGSLLVIGIRRNTVALALYVSAVIVAAITIARVAANRLLEVRGHLPGVVHTVGIAAYAGFSKSAELRAVNIPIALAGAFAVLAGFIWFRFRGGRFFERFSIANRTPVRLGFFVLLLAITVPFLFPSAAAYLSLAKSPSHSSDFDHQNFYTWEFLTYQGKLPWRDFWFPHSGFYNRLAHLYPYFMYNFFHNLVLLAVLLWCALKIFESRLSVVLGCCTLFFLLIAGNIVLDYAASRYLLSFSILVITAVAVQEISLVYFVVFGTWCSYVLSQELSQLIYALPASALLITIGLVKSDRAENRIRLLRNVVLGVGVALASILVYFVVLYRREQLPHWWLFVKSLGDMADYGAFPAPIHDWLVTLNRLDSALYLLTLLLIVSGVCHLIWRGPGRPVYDALPLCTGLLSWFLLQKQVIRYGMETQILDIPLFGLIILAYQRVSQRVTTRHILWLCLGSSVLFGCFILDATVWNQAVLPRLQEVTALPRNLRAAFFEKDAWREADRAFFSPAFYKLDGHTGVEIRNSLAAMAPMTSGDAVYVLGNDSVLYIFLDKPVPYCNNLFSDSPIAVQTNTLRWLEKHQPKYVLWDAEQNEFDTVPNSVRIPLIFTYVLQHYVPLSVEGKYQVLRRMQPNEQPAIAYWRKMLGSTIDLGYIPALSTVDQQEGGTQQSLLLTVRVSEPRDGGKISIPVQVGDDEYTLRFSTQSGRNHYVIRLDRVPIIEAATASGAELRVKVPTHDGIQASTHSALVPTDDLY